MKKKYIFLMLLPIFSLNAQDFSGQYWGEVKNTKTFDGKLYYFEATYTFMENKYNLAIDCSGQFNAFEIPKSYIKNVAGIKTYSENGRYHTESKEGFSYIIFDNSEPLKIIDSVGCLRYKDDFLFLDGKRVLFQCFSNYFDDDNVQEVLDVRTSSFLSEKNIKYNGENYGNIQNDLCPWVEGVEKSGIGEWIEITFRMEKSNDKDLCFLISNGYVDFSRRDLFYANNRVKRFKIECKELKIDFDAYLEDTPQFQCIKIPKFNYKNGIFTFRFTIKDVHKGNKYDDTCINLIVPYQE